MTACVLSWIFYKCRCFVLMSKYLFERFQFSFSVTEKEAITNLISVLLIVFFFLTLGPRVVYSSEYLSDHKYSFIFVFQCVIRSQYIFTNHSVAGGPRWIFLDFSHSTAEIKHTSVSCNRHAQVSTLHHHFTLLPHGFCTSSFFQIISYYHRVSETSWVSSKM